MLIQYFQEYSFQLHRDMSFKVYGEKGKPCLVFPGQEGRFFDFENYGLLDDCKRFVEQGLVQFFCVDSIDFETWTNSTNNPRTRIQQHEKWYNYICDELVPRIHQINKKMQSYDKSDLFVLGCNLGASHALNFFLRRPDLFDSVIALSGLYHAHHYFNDYSDDLVYINSPIQCIEKMNQDHFYIDLYKQSKIILCVGQGQWEEKSLADTQKMQQIFIDKEIRAQVEYWGTDVNHDWSWWRKQLPYYIPYILSK